MSPTYFSSNSSSGKKIAEAIERLKVKKQSLHLSNKQIADNSKCVLSESAVQRFFSGENADPSMQTFIEVATAMGMTVEEAFGVSIPTADHSHHQHIDHDMCEKRIVEQKAHYDEQLTQCRLRFNERLGDLKESHSQEVTRLSRWLIFIAAAFLTLVAVIIFFVIYDVTHPSIGWVQYNRSVTLDPATTTEYLRDIIRRLTNGKL